MKIMAVDNRMDRLAGLVRLLRAAFPGCDVVAYTDPLLAVQYSYQNEVDLLFADVPMRGMTGVQVAEAVRRFCPGVEAYLLQDAEEPARQPDAPLAAGRLVRPVTAETLRRLRPGGQAAG